MLETGHFITVLSVFTSNRHWSARLFVPSAQIVLVANFLSTLCCFFGTYVTVYSRFDEISSAPKVSLRVMVS